jgi:U3 small nucleolar RNA-associated protein 20
MRITCFNRLVTFGMDLFNTALRRGRFDYKDPAIISRLEAMVVAVGNSLYSNSSPVLVRCMKAVSGLVRCPLKTLNKSIPVYTRQIIDIVKQTGSTEAEVVQTAFKSLATILRDGSSDLVKEKDLVYLLELLSPDLEEPSRQASVFTMLRAIVARKFVVPEIYDLMDKVSEIMVTNQSPSVQELCRGVLLQFLLDYPQGKGRLRNQMTFLAKNLSYVYENGRKSVMELLSAVIAKFEVGLIREYADMLFVALIMVIVNDDSSKCREMAAELIKSLFVKLDDEHRRLVMSHLHAWGTQYSQPQLVKVASQAYGFVVDVLESDTIVYVPRMLEDLNAIVERSAQQLSSLEDEDEHGMDVDLEWQTPYHSLTVLSKILRVFPNFTTEQDKIMWHPIVTHLLFPHAWVRSVSCRLLGVLFSATPVAAPDAALPDTSPLSKVGMCEVAKILCLQLKSEHLDETLGLQIVKNLFYIGKCFCSMAAPARSNDRDEDDVSGPGEDGDGDEITEPGNGVGENLLPWLFSKLSYQVKSAHITRRNRSSSAVRRLFHDFFPV